MATFCANCGSKLDEDGKFCAACGTPTSEYQQATKYCPFCKNKVEVGAVQCPHCKRTLIEKVSIAQSTSENLGTPPPKETATKASITSYYTPPKKSSAPQKQSQLPRGSGWIISIVVSIILAAILSNSGSGNSSSNLAPSNPLPPPVSATTTNLQQTPIVPAPSTLLYNSLPNGTVFFSSASLDGSGVLTISNGGSQDAVVKLITVGGVKVYSVYVDANGSYSIKNINDGVYRVLFEFGSDWSTSQKTFLVNPSAEDFDSTFDFETTETQTDIHYTTYSITLNPVEGGTATTDTIDPSQFNQY